MDNTEERLVMHCSNCGTEITKKIPKSKRERNSNFFCNKKCYQEWWGRNVVSGEKNVNWKGGPIDRICLSCGTSIKVRVHSVVKGHGRFCSTQCSAQYNAYTHKGSRNFNWKGGISKEYDKIKQSVAYKEWRAEVYKRDYWTCQSCGYKGKGIVAHHIKRFSEYPSLRTDVDNGITLCRSCHIKLHSPHILPKSVETKRWTSGEPGEVIVRSVQECTELDRNDLALRVNEE